MSDELEQLRQAVRLHRDQRGDDRCWMDDEALYKTLPEGYIPPERDTTVELVNCQRYIMCRRNPATEYVSPQRRIEELEKEVERLSRPVPDLLSLKIKILERLVVAARMQHAYYRFVDGRQDYKELDAEYKALGYDGGGSVVNGLDGGGGFVRDELRYCISVLTEKLKPGESVVESLIQELKNQGRTDG